MIRLDDTSNCPLNESCIYCGTIQELVVATLESPVGVFCITMCDECGESGVCNRLPGLPVADAVRASLEHCAHLGIDGDEMAALMEAEH
jgi:hypothetical protein